MNPFSLIANELPKFLTEMKVPFLGKDEPTSVMKEPSTAQQEKWQNENLLALAGAALPASRLAGSILSMAAKAPRSTAIATAVATQDPSAVFLGPAGQLATYSPDTEAAIRPGGRADLFMTHNWGGSVGQLLDFVRGKKSLTAPSIAINNNTAFPFAESPSLVFNPNSHAFDPRYAKANQLFNRDAYVETGKTAPDTRDLRYGQDQRFTQMVPWDPMKTLAIAQSPKFNSFADFERSPVGAKLLKRLTADGDVRYFQPEQETQKYLSDLFEEVIGGPKANSEIQLLLKNLEKMAKNDPNLSAALDESSVASSLYAELKPAGTIPLTDRTLAGVILPHSMRARESGYNGFGEVARELADRIGRPVGAARDIASAPIKKMWETQAELMSKRMQEAAKEFKVVAKRGDVPAEVMYEQAYNTLPWYMKKYLPASTYRLFLFDNDAVNIAPEQLYNRISSSNAASADVAAYLTNPPSRPGR